MSQPTNIEWTEQSWNFLRGCSRVSEGCGVKGAGGCYAERQAMRFAGPGGPYEGLVRMTPNGPRWTGGISFHEHILLEPLKRKKPTKYFVNSMSDLFHEKVTDEILDKAFAVMALTPQHTYQILTKRPERMREYFTADDGFGPWGRVETIGKRYMRDIFKWSYEDLAGKTLANFAGSNLPHVHLGVSVEDQKTADERIPHLLNTPAAIRWISYEPALGPVNFTQFPVAHGVWANFLTGRDHIDDGREVVHQDGTPVQHNKLDWIVVGGESGPGARPFDIQWARDIIAQCKAADVPVFVKQLGAKPQYQRAENGGPLFDVIRKLKSKKGNDPSEWPEDLRVREFPNV